jgi:membrane associated rhomboid family serine protease/Flp pilus assembly protein TadD
MATCAQCGRDFQPDVEGQQLCAACRPPQFEVAQPRIPTRRNPTPLELYLFAPTSWLIAANVIAFIATCVWSRSFVDVNLETLLRFGANYGPLTLGGQPWRMLTSMFLHGGILHIAFNMWALLNLGILAEILFGRKSFVGMYLLCGLSGSIASVWWHFHTGHPEVIGVGASGAIFGIAGALIPALALQKNARLRAALRGNLSSIVIFVIYTVVLGSRSAHIDNSAHLGGLVCGLILGVALPSSPGWDQHTNQARRVTAFLLASVATLACFAWLQKSQIAVLDYARAQDAYRRKDLNGAVDYLHKSLEHAPRSLDSHFMLGLVYLEQEKYDDAKQQFVTATEIDPKFANAYGELCVANLKLRDLSGALVACKRAVELDANDPDKQFNLGLTQRANEDLPGALQSFTNAERLRPNGFDEEAMLGEALADSGRTNDAVVHLRLAYKAKPSDQHVRFLLARLLLNVGKREEARRVMGQ